MKRRRIVVVDGLPSRVKDIRGRRYGRLVAQSFVGLAEDARAQWRFRCDCGQEIVRKLTNIRSGHTQSCGCLVSEVTAKRNATHGLSKTREYRIWSGAIKRCEDPNCKSYPDYGGRGIRVALEWRHDFPRFLADMGLAPEGYTIERIDGARGYEPGNCRWIPKREQSRNRRGLHEVTFNGETRTLSSWAEVTGIQAPTILARLKAGWSIERTLTDPVRPW